MPVLSDAELEREAVVLAQRLRICELQGDLRQVAEAFRRAERVVRDVLIGAGASMEEQLRAATAAGEVDAILRAALARPTPPLALMRCTAWLDGQQCINMALPGRSLCGGAHLLQSDGAATADAQQAAGSATSLGPAAADPAGSDPASPMHVCVVLPLRRDLGVRFKPRSTVYEQSAGEPLHAVDAKEPPK